MTTIAIDKNLVIASDTLGTVGSRVACKIENKVEKIGNDYVMGAGSTANIMEFIEWYKDEEASYPNLNNCEILVMRGKKVYAAVQSEGGSIHYIECMLPAACGSGGDVALGAMLAGKTAEEAVKLASTVDVYTGGRVKTYNKKTKKL